MTADGPASPRYVTDAVEIILKVHRTQGSGHVLAFFTGQDEIERACKLLHEAIEEEERASRGPRGGQGTAGRGGSAIDADGDGKGGAVEGKRPQRLLVVPLYGALPAEAQAQAFRPVPKGVRKVRACEV